MYVILYVSNVPIWLYVTKTSNRPTHEMSYAASINTLNISLWVLISVFNSIEYFNNLIGHSSLELFPRINKLIN